MATAHVVETSVPVKNNPLDNETIFPHEGDATLTKGNLSLGKYPSPLAL